MLWGVFCSYFGAPFIFTSLAEFFKSLVKLFVFVFFFL